MNIKELFFKRKKEEPMKTFDSGFLLREGAEEYHAKSGEYLSSHRLADFRRNPLLFRKKELGLIEESDRPAFLLGRAAHTLILEGGEVFAAEYAVGGPINSKTGEPYGTRTKAYQEWAEAQGRAVLDSEQYRLVMNMHNSINAHAHAKELLSNGLPEGVVRAEYMGVPCQARLDWFSPDHGIVDLKTCDCMDWLVMDAHTYGYAHQLAFYRAVVAAVLGVNVPAWLISVEKREPFRCGVWRMGDDVLGIAHKENEQAIERLKKCRETNIWPTGYEDVRVFDYL